VRVDRVQSAGGVDRIVATITDDGIGGALIGQVGAPAISSGGLAGIRDRAVAAGGSLRVSSPVGGPTVISVEVPCAS
jgi:signal transduction histidine kinase